MGCDLVAGIVTLLRDRLGLAGGYFEAITGDDDVGGIGRAGDLAAVNAMAECLTISMSASQPEQYSAT